MLENCFELRTPSHYTHLTQSLSYPPIHLSTQSLSYQPTLLPIHLPTQSLSYQPTLLPTHPLAYPVPLLPTQPTYQPAYPVRLLPTHPPIHLPPQPLLPASC
ncbi:hypothetical protein Pcinc_041030 [Petrolisthes cinctipes]|uniref:Uncharacterized protein n=1 Tax=Petrolisthes cinctipes TaxID=88211 RepID=A0AAE1BKY2_PETCI|nr:hypothetical protein Pcinc_041030 [Petrolisthes cinctipes]